jgi:hypothetical protein
MDHRRGSTSRHVGISRKSISLTSRRGILQTSILSAFKKNERMLQVQDKRRAEIQGIFIRSQSLLLILNILQEWI